MRKTRWSVLVALVLTIVAVTATPGAAFTHGGPIPTEGAAFRSTPADVRAKMSAQEPLAAAATRLELTVDRTAATGYAGIVLGGDQLKLWWKGVMPAAVRDAVADARRIAPVSVVQAAHSRAELVSAANDVADYIRANPGSPYYGVEVAYNGSGLVIDANPAAGRSAATLVPASLPIPAGMAYSVSVVAPPTLTGRQDDTAPYSSGGRIQNNDNTEVCTAGWPVVRSGVQYMLTAGHCGRVGGRWNNGNDSRFFGIGAYENVTHDLLLVSASVKGRMWDGGVGSGEFSKGIARWEPAFSGQYLCTSGATSGAVCNFLTSDVFLFSYCDTDIYGHRECYSDLILATQVDGRPGSRGGDSGGPVFSLSGSDRVVAKGTISGVRNPNELIFQDFLTATRDFGISAIVTG